MLKKLLVTVSWSKVQISWQMAAFQAAINYLNELVSEIETLHETYTLSLCTVLAHKGIVITDCTVCSLFFGYCFCVVDCSFLFLSLCTHT